MSIYVKNPEGDKVLPRPECTYADHSYPAYSKAQMLNAANMVESLEQQLASVTAERDRLRIGAAERAHIKLTLDQMTTRSEAAEAGIAEAEKHGGYWLVWYDDKDRPPEIFTDESAALRRYEQISVSWNAHLFARIHANSRDSYAAPIPSPDTAELIRKAREEATEAESQRWATRLNWIHQQYDVDGSGTDSGDALDVIESEIQQAIRAIGTQPDAADYERFFPFEFEVWMDDEMVAGASGTREDAMREAMNYAAQYEQDGCHVRVFEVVRYVRHDSAKVQI